MQVDVQASSSTTRFAKGTYYAGPPVSDLKDTVILFITAPPSFVLPLLPQLNHMVETHKRLSHRMLEQLLEVTRSHRETLRKLEEQERNHKAFSHKSKCLTTLLEQDRERLVSQTPEVQTPAWAKPTLIYYPSHWSIMTRWCMLVNSFSIHRHVELSMAGWCCCICSTLYVTSSALHPWVGWASRSACLCSLSLVNTKTRTHMQLHVQSKLAPWWPIQQRCAGWGLLLLKLSQWVDGLFLDVSHEHGSVEHDDGQWFFPAIWGPQRVCCVLLKFPVVSAHIPSEAAL